VRPLANIDTRPFFRPMCRDIVALLRSLGVEDWLRPTMAGTWRVRDVAAHLVDTALRRLSIHRDAARLPERLRPASDRNLVALINDLNATWIRAAERLSTRVLVDLYDRVSIELADFIETLDLDGEAVFAVSWAGETRSAQWLDIGREFTEVWHHGAQIRDAVGAGAFSNADWLRAVLRIAMRALPHAYRDVPARPGVSVVVEVTGRSAGTWTVLYDGHRGWDFREGGASRPQMTATMTDETAWRLLFNALSAADAASLVQVQGDASLAPPLFRARSVVV